MEISIAEGKLRGTVAVDYTGEQYLKFQGIPYAKPPLGTLRFKAPEAPEKWSGVLDATKEGSPCYARHTIRYKEFVGSENCLFLNVYTKKVFDKENNLRPVLVWIHGGTFLTGCGGTEFYGPDFLIIEDVVIVTLNYRLGILGFLSLEDPTLKVPGNAGLKDIVMALRWVKRNIVQFNGNPDNVTIFGQSVGGAMAHLVMLSPMSNGLFHKVIAQSGCALNPWVQGRRSVKEIASVLGLEDCSERNVYKHLINLPVEKMYEVQEKILQDFASYHPRALACVIENKSSEPAFLAEQPLDIMKSGRFNHVPLMIGYTTEETMIFDLFRKGIWPAGTPFQDVVSWDLGYQFGSDESRTVAEELLKFYYDSDVPSAKNFHKRIMMNSDANFFYGIYSTVLNLLSISKIPIYLYRMSVDTELNFAKRSYRVKMAGVAHLDDLGYLFKQVSTPDIVPGSQEDLAVKRFVKLWTNFAKFGNPTPHKEDALLNVSWSPVTNERIDFLDIGEELVASSNSVEHRRLHFLRGLYKRIPIRMNVTAHL